MGIQVIYHNDDPDSVDPSLLDQLISANQIKRFLRSGGWASVAADPVRGCGGSYEGPERRKLSIPETIMQRVSHLRQTVESNGKILVGDDEESTT